jgi:hypothetical protein
VNNLKSLDGRFETVIQGDGNLVTYDLANGKPVWDSQSGKWRGVDAGATWPPANPEPGPGPDPGPGPEPGPGPAPPADRRILLGNFCNIRDSRNRPIFSSCFLAQTDAMKDEWISREIDAGGNCYTFSVETGYGSFSGPKEWGYGEVINFYRTGRFGEVLDGLDRILKRGLVPRLFLDSGGPFPGTPYLTELAAAFPAAYREPVDWVVAWEPVKGDWKSDEFSRAIRGVRGVLGDSPILQCHLSPERAAGSSNPPEDADPWKSDEVGFWFGYGGEQFDGILYQSSVPLGNGRDKTNHFGELGWKERGIEVAERFLPPGTPMPGAAGFKMEGDKDPVTGIPECRVHPGVAGFHSWFGANGNGRKRGIPALTWFEATAYTYIREQSDEAWAREVATWAKSVGFQGFGNGLPY